MLMLLGSLFSLFVTGGAGYVFKPLSVKYDATYTARI